MIELVLIILAGCVIIGVVNEICKGIDRREAERYEARSKARLLEELRRH